VKNYRVQDGCWNCEYLLIEDFGYDAGCLFCTVEQELPPCGVDLYGICDLYEKEDE